MSHTKEFRVLVLADFKNSHPWSIMQNVRVVLFAIRYVWSSVPLQL